MVFIEYRNFVVKLKNLLKTILHLKRIKSKHYMKSFLYLLGILSTWSIVVACSSEDVVEKSDRENYPIAIFENVRRIYSEEGIIKIKIEAPLEYIYQDENVVYPQNVRISMFDLNGQITTTLTADSGRFERIPKLYHAYGNVEVVNYEKEQKVNTPELHWNQLKREIYTEKEIAIKTPTETLYGIGMVSNEEFSKYKIKKPTGSFVYRERSEGFARPDGTDMQRKNKNQKPLMRSQIN